ncbi:glycoside hydrolase family 57 protein [Geotalea uraniireducens]|uniref:Glycoside hydrolase, family 57 n=1 Tax=Geotalea uraniireducens (strain Rf4) TaxID=351605 RepID=A5GBI5_GEOUR|nr:glycoside hydrolase family 57 protein [Geotalea uraniireducens]ABQ25062.1 glycoside hydrolase, family 57 [Geotalea uraniireducens Rf4]
MPNPLYITFLWHMHQPYYKDPLRGEYTLPWTYLHAVKDYYDMAAIVDETPGVRVVFNLVPSLLEQIRDYASGSAVDQFLIHGQMAPSAMAEEERIFILENFFSANRQRMIEPYKRYLELYCLAGDGAGGGMQERLRHFRDQDILDLQVWFFLAWTGEAARRRYPEFRELIRKGKNFTQADKALLFARHKDLLNEIIPLYRKLHDEGKAELSVTPYFHPILPLLCDMKSARTAMPKVILPTVPFKCPEDARSQVARGIACFEEFFGFTPQGMWPSEGSVSDEALGILAECGLVWAATDEGVLSHTLHGGIGASREALYHPYSFQQGGKELALFFRDHALSDRIGFTYSQWEPERAAADFTARLLEIRGRVHGARVVPVILDGENAWEYYPDNGYTFLRRLYGMIAETPGLEPATFSEVLARVPGRRVITHIHPGSWINANYGVWVGHPEENLGWDYLARAREAAVENNPTVAALLAGRGHDGAAADGTTAQLVCQSLYAAEGSDWFWWYGDDHFSPHSDRFDALFRRHLMNVYRLLGLDAPRELFEPIKKKSPAGLVREPAALISPVISGIVTDYFEWLAAGLYDLTRQSSAMHAAESLMQSFFYGFDRKFLFFRVDGVQSLEKTMQAGDRLNLQLIHDNEFRLTMSLGADEGSLLVKSEGEWRETGTLCRWKIIKIAEARVPLEIFNLMPGDKLFAFVTLMRGDEELGRWPTDAPLLINYAGPDLELETWLI